jgi:L-alanine-DL-glutamate epimerase-like enolase superfamily enzyme
MNRAVVDSLRAAAYTIPTDAPEADGTADWDSTTVVVVTAYSGDAAGIGWTYAPAACARVVEDMLKPVVCEGDVMSVAGLWARMCRAVRNATRPGIAGYAISAVDVALWDLKARILGLPLADLFGRARESVPVYGSGGFTTYSDARLTEQLSGWTVDQQIPRVKIKIGEGAGTR